MKEEDQKLEEAIDTAMVDGRISRFGCRAVARGYASYEKKRLLTQLLQEVEELEPEETETYSPDYYIALEQAKSLIQKHIENK